MPPTFADALRAFCETYPTTAEARVRAAGQLQTAIEALGGALCGIR